MSNTTLFKRLNVNFSRVTVNISHYLLAAAVPEADGLRFASGGMTGDSERNSWCVNSQTNHSLLCDVMQKNVRRACECYHRRKVPIVTTGAGTPKFILPALKAGIKVFRSCQRGTC